MENPIPYALAPSNSRRRISTDSANSPEFEFWKFKNQSIPQPDLISADELFVNGVLLPLHLLHLHPNHRDPPDDNPQLTTQNPDTDTDPEPKPKSDPGSGPELSNPQSDPLTAALGVSKRWRDMFKKRDGKGGECKEKLEKKKERKGNGGGGVSGAELNIYIWPFSRSRSAGNGGNRPRTAVTRKVSSAPCSRSNSAGESKTSRSNIPSPSRGGVHLGRSSPVWKVRRGVGGAHSGRSFDPVAVVRSQKEGNETVRKKTVGGGGGENKARALNLNVPMCIAYRQHLSCRSDGSSAVNGGAVDVGGGGSGDGEGDGGGRGGNLFNLRSLFSKKVY